MFKGIDLSYSQPNIDWNTLSQQQLDFIYVKVCEGLRTLDTMRNANSSHVRVAGWHVGYYYFAHPGRCDAKASAQFFKAQLATLPTADMLPALDIEINEEGITPPEMLQWIHDFIEEFGGPIMIYGGPGFLDLSLPADHDLGKYPLWLAEYEGTPAPTQYPTGWNDCAIWQDSGKGTVPGIPEAVDLDISNNLPLLQAA